MSTVMRIAVQLRWYRELFLVLIQDGDFFISYNFERRISHDFIWWTGSQRPDRPGYRWRRNQGTDQQRKGNFLHRFWPDRWQSSCRPFHGTLPDETSADGRQPSNRLNRRRYSYDRWPIRPYRYASDDDTWNHPAQCWLFQETDVPFHWLFRRQSTDGQQRWLADELKLHRAASWRRCPLLCQPYADSWMLQAAYGTRIKLPGIQLHDHAELRFLWVIPEIRL